MYAEKAIMQDSMKPSLRVHDLAILLQPVVKITMKTKQLSEI
jgi:hypothetical protein